MVWSEIEELKDSKGAPMHLGDRVVYRYEQTADNEHEAISVESYGTIIHLVVKEADIDNAMFKQDDGKSWVIHDEDLPFFTVIDGKGPHTSM